MIITLDELYVLLDTLIGSLKIADGNRNIWHFDAKTRENIANNILNRLKSVKLKVENRVSLETNSEDSQSTT